MQNEKNQIQKITYCVILFHDILGKAKLEDRNQTNSGKTRRQKSSQFLLEAEAGSKGSIATWYEEFLRWDENIVYPDNVGGHTTVYICYSLANCTVLKGYITTSMSCLNKPDF